MNIKVIASVAKIVALLSNFTASVNISLLFIRHWLFPYIMIIVASSEKNSKTVNFYNRNKLIFKSPGSSIRIYFFSFKSIEKFCEKFYKYYDSFLVFKLERVKNYVVTNVPRPIFCSLRKMDRSSFKLLSFISWPRRKKNPILEDIHWPELVALL